MTEPPTRGPPNSRWWIASLSTIAVLLLTAVFQAGVLWGQMADLRTDIRDLRSEVREVAHEALRTCRTLEPR